jgi:sugar phosphate isomerase/epimerase
MDPKHFGADSQKMFGINAVEYVAAFYKDQLHNATYFQEMKEETDALGIENLVMMVDGEGDLGTANESQRAEAVYNHKKWIDACAILGIKVVRVNAFGDEDLSIYKKQMIKSLQELADYAAPLNMSISIENHGLYSSRADVVVEMLTATGKTNVGTYPDFGNWCYSKKWGGIDSECEQAYDIYQGTEQWMPLATNVSAKTYDFQEDGEQALMDFSRLMAIVKKSGFEGYIGIEYEGNNLSEPEGIMATKALIEKYY